MNRFAIPALALLALGLAACQTPATETEAPDASVASTDAVDTAAARAAIQAMSDAYEVAAQAGDAAAITAMHSDDALLHPAGRPAVRGRQAVDAMLNADHAEPADLQLTTTEIVISESGDMAYEVGTIGGAGAAGKYLTVYRNSGDGWQIVADTWSDDTPPAGTAAN